ncbi:unnamed protein product, partial [Urochloa humidicola]
GGPAPPGRAPSSAVADRDGAVAPRVAATGGGAGVRQAGDPGPALLFLAGSLPEPKRLVVATRRQAPPLDVGCHDIMPFLLPPFHRWVADSL